MIELERPIAFIDLETTGIDVANDRIVEVSVCKLHPAGNKEYYHQRVDPLIPIPEQATAIHGITNNDVLNSPSFQVIADYLFTFIEGCDIGGYNSNKFDVPILYCEFLRSNIIWDYSPVHFIDVCNIFRIKESHTLSAAYRFYCHKELQNAHSASADVTATVEIFSEQLNKYTDLPDNIKDLQTFCNRGKQLLDISGKFTYDDNGDIVFAFGKHNGKKAKHNMDYVKWMYYKAGEGFNPDTLDVCRKLLSLND